MILTVKANDPQVEGITLYAHKDDKCMGIEIKKPDTIMLFKGSGEGMQLKESALYEILLEYFEKNF